MSLKLFSFDWMYSFAEEEFGGFLGRLLGTIYRNADPIDESISGGLR